jgi:hypothetical protein
MYLQFFRLSLGRTPSTWELLSKTYNKSWVTLFLIGYFLSSKALVQTIVV